MSAHGLRGAVRALRRRALAVGLATALASAVAADLVYDDIAALVGILTPWSIFFPPFLLVVLLVLAALALHRTRPLAFARAVDEDLGLKGRLEAAERFRRDERVPADLVEAQARETLGVLDTAAVRRGLRFRPWPQLGVIVAASLGMALLLRSFPGYFRPGSLVLRGGAALVSRTGGRVTRAGGSTVAVPSAAPATAAKRPEAAPGAGRPGPAARPVGAGGDVAQAPPGGEGPPAARRRETKREPPAGPGPATAAKKPAAGRQERHAAGEPRGEPRPGAGNTGGTVGRSVSLEVTAAPSALAEPPPRTGLLSGLPPVRLPGARGDLPPIPLVRLLAGGAGKGTLLDPDAVTIVPEAYAPAYREHIVGYFRGLLALWEESHGS